MKIDVWSDIACPWCWLGKHHLQEALKRTNLDATVEFHSYELQPGAGAPRPVRDYLLEKYGNAETVDAAHKRLADMGRRVGITYDFERALMANTFDAHRLHHLAKTRGLEEPVMERFLKARQAEGADMSAHDTLRRLATEAGLDPKDVDDVLGSDRFAEDVRRDEALASQYGIRGVPFFVFERRFALSGAQPVEVFEKALREARLTPPTV